MPPMHYLPGKFAMALLIAGGMAIAGCHPQQVPGSTPSGDQSQDNPIAEPSSSEDATPTPIAAVQEIIATPVSVTLDQGEPMPAQLNQALAYGDRVSTEDQALAEVKLVNGPVFRLGGQASLTLRPNQLLLNAGQMITWVEGTLTTPVEIVTPAGIAGIRGTTVFVNIDEDPAAPVEFFAWEGQVAFRLVAGGEEILLNSGEQLFVFPGEQDIDALRQRVQPLDRATALQRLAQSPLLNGFSRPIPTRPELEATVDTLD